MGRPMSGGSLDASNANAQAAMAQMSPEARQAAMAQATQGFQGAVGGVGAPRPAPQAPAPPAQAEGVFAPQTPESQAPQYDLGNLRGGGGPMGMVPAHSVSLVSPESRAGFEKAEADKLAAADMGAKAEVGANDADVTSIQGLADALKNQQAAQVRSEAERRKAYDAQKGDYDRIQRKASEGKIDTENHDFLAPIALGFGALGAGLTGGPNFALMAINKKVDDKIAAQRAAIENNQASAKTAQNGLQEMRARFGDDRAADAAERGRQLEQAKAAGDVLVAQGQEPHARGEVGGHPRGHRGRTGAAACDPREVAAGGACGWGRG